MKTLVNALATAVRNTPKAVIAVTIVLTVVLGMFFGGQFLPETDSNASFAPDAPELAASTEIAQTFGAVARMQVLTSSDEGDVITLDAYKAAEALDTSIRGSDAAEFLVEAAGAPAVLSHLAPVQFAVQNGAPVPTSDAEVKALYLAGLDELPAQSRSFLVALVSNDADFDNATAEFGLASVLYASSDDFDVSGQRAIAIGDAVLEAETPESVTMGPFSQELIFGSGDDFQAEILRLFLSAGLIILLVLSIVFVVKPGSMKDRRMFFGGMVLMVAGAAVSVAPGLALLMPDTFPTSWGEASIGSVLLIALSLYAAAFLAWSVGTKRLRRTAADTLLTFLTIGFAIQLMNGYGYLRFGDQSQMVQILPILLIGLGVDYSIHMTTRYRQELSQGASVDAAISTAIRTVGVALVLATLTTAVGFLTNVTNSIPALAEFGELAAVGIGFSFLLMLTFVPAVRELLDRRAEKFERLDTGGLESGEARVVPRLVGRTSVLAQKFAAATIVVALAFTGLGLYGWLNLSTQFSFLDFVPTTSPIRDTAITINENFDFPESTSVLVSGDVATGAAWNSMLVSYSATAGVQDVVTVATPSGDFPTGSTFMGVMFGFLNPSPDNANFDVDLFNAAQEVGFGQDRRVPDAADLNDFYDIAVENHPLVMAAVLASEDDSYSAALYNFDTVANEVRAADLAVGLNAAFAQTSDAGLVSVATSSFIISDLIVTSLRESQLASLMLTLGAALLLLVANFWFESRRPLLGLITTVPVVMVVLWTFGIMWLLGIPFGPVTSLVSALGIGIGIPYMIHVTHRYLEERIEREDENEAIKQTLTHTGGALGGSALTTVFGFGILVTSTTIPFQQLGFVLAYTIVLALGGAVLVLPSMLVLWDRWHRSRGDDPFDADAVRDALSLES